MKRNLSLFLICSLAVLACSPLAAQTFEINPQGGAQATPASPQAKPGNKNQNPAASSGTQGSLSWGSSIEVARTARAADNALRRNDFNGALVYAERAAHAAPQDINMWLMYGYAARGAGRLQVALDAYNRGLQLNPSSVEALSGLAQTYMRMGQTDQAKQILRKVLALNPRRANDLMMAGELFIQSGDYNGALQLLQRADAIQPSARADLLQALAYQHLHKPEQARQLLDRARSKAPNNPEVLRALAGYYRETRDYQAAINTLHAVPNQSADVLAEVGYTYELWGKRKEAATNYGRAASMAPGQLTYQLSAASSVLSLGDLKQARVYLDRAQKIDPNYYRVHAIRAEVAKQENHYDEAIREFNAALSSLPESSNEGVLYPMELRVTLGELYRALGDDNASHQQYQAAFNQMQHMNIEGPTRAEFLRLRGSLKANLNDPEGALADLKEAAALDPTKPDILLQYGSVLWRVGQKNEARKQYERVLTLDAKNEWAMTALGYLARDMGDTKSAEAYFHKLAAAYPTNYVPYLALGDMYTADRHFAEANDAYDKGWKLAPTNPLLVAGGANVGIEWHKFDLSKTWLDRANAEMNTNPYVMRERERYLTWTGKYAESAQLAEQTIKKLPKDRDVIVYYGYDLLHLGRYDDLLQLTSKYEKVLPKDADLPLLAGYVHKNAELLHEAVDDFTRAIERGPEVRTAFVNRGYVYNDLQNAEAASVDFNKALQLDPKDGSAQLGMAFAQLELHHGKTALDHAQAAQKLLGESGAIHDAMATAYRQQGLLAQAEKEYRAALKYSPDDLKLHLALADTQYHLRRYDDSLASLRVALAYSPDDPFIYAQMAHSYAELNQRDETLRYVQTAEKIGYDQSDVLLATGDALLALGDRDAALDRFGRALDAPDSDRVEARLAVARVLQREGRWDAAREQVSLAFAESRIGEASPITAEHLLQAADMFLRMHGFDMAVKLFERARAAGAADQVVAIGLANTYLEKGDSLDAQRQLASLGSPSQYQENYDYMLAQANVYRQQRHDLLALSAFAHANQIAGQDDVAERELEEMAGQEGLRLTEKVSVLTDFAVSPIYEDSTIYQMDARMFGATGQTLPPPRSSLETRWTSAYRVHEQGLPTISGFFQVRSASGTTSLPAENVILNRNTLDYNFNGALNPVLRLGHNSITFNTGLQFTVRRDKNDPIDVNQNLFRQFVYANTNSLGNWLTIRGEGIHESGPFSLRDLHSRELVGRVEFQVGRPWGTTSLITGYVIDDLLFRPLVREWFTTSTYIGLQHRFGQKLTVRGLAQYIRGWRVQDMQFALGQALRPGAEIHYVPKKNWSVDANFALSRGMGMHTYDNATSGVFVTYQRKLRRTVDDGLGTVPVDYPLRLSIGLENDTFYNFNSAGGVGSQMIMRPVIHLSIF
ncbi:MAG: tetratricopeptide repeat protein [Terriglobales bacterium]